MTPDAILQGIKDTLHTYVSLLNDVICMEKPTILVQYHVCKLIMYLYIYLYVIIRFKYNYWIRIAILSEHIIYIYIKACMNFTNKIHFA